MLVTSTVIPRVLCFLGFIFVYSSFCFCGSKSLFPAYSSPSKRSSWRLFASVFTRSSYSPIRRASQVSAFVIVPSWDAPAFPAFTLKLYGIQTRILCRHCKTTFRCAAARLRADRRGTCQPFFAKIFSQTVQACALQPIYCRLTQTELLGGDGFG